MLAEIERAGLPGAKRDGIVAAVNQRLVADPGHQRVLLVIDQFEELLVQTANARLRDLLSAIDEVTTAANAYTKVTVILIMRDDFYPQLASLAPKLLEAAMPGLLNVPGTLSQQDLHDIITLPARDVGLRFQSGLPERIIGDVLEITPEGAITCQAPVTVLPLLEMALSQLWLRRQDGYLAHEAYRRIGGVSGSVTTWCDSALSELSEEQRTIARRPRARGRLRRLTRRAVRGDEVSCAAVYGAIAQVNVIGRYMSGCTISMRICVPAASLKPNWR